MEQFFTELFLQLYLAIASKLGDGWMEAMPLDNCVWHFFARIIDHIGIASYVSSLSAIAGALVILLIKCRGNRRQTQVNTQTDMVSLNAGQLVIQMTAPKNERIEMKPQESTPAPLGVASASQSIPEVFKEVSMEQQQDANVWKNASYRAITIAEIQKLASVIADSMSKEEVQQAVEGIGIKVNRINESPNLITYITNVLKNLNGRARGNGHLVDFLGHLAFSPENSRKFAEEWLLTLRS